MPVKFTLATTLALAVANAISTQINAKKAAHLYLNAVEAYEATEAEHLAQIEYLCHMLDAHGVPATEFDLIALNQLM